MRVDSIWIPDPRSERLAFIGLLGLGLEPRTLLLLMPLSTADVAALTALSFLPARCLLGTPALWALHIADGTVRCLVMIV